MDRRDRSVDIEETLVDSSRSSHRHPRGRDGPPSGTYPRAGGLNDGMDFGVAHVAADDDADVAVGVLAPQTNVLQEGAFRREGFQRSTGVRLFERAACCFIRGFIVGPFHLGSCRPILPCVFVGRAVLAPDDDRIIYGDR